MRLTGSQRLLIINADDLGLAPGVTDGILDLARRGAVTSASILMNMPRSDEAMAAARAANLDVGLHLNLCTGEPLSPPNAVPSLLTGGTDGRVRFASAGAIHRRYLSGRLALEDVAREWATQIERFLATGATPSHLDSHCHVHALPRLYRLTVELARRYGIPGIRRAYSHYIVRSPPLAQLSACLGRSRRSGPPYSPDYLSVLTVMGPARTPRALHALLHALPRGVTELVCHPGHVDDELRRIDTLTDAREREWLLLSRPHLQEALAREGIDLVSWRAIANLN